MIQHAMRVRTGTFTVMYTRCKQHGRALRCPICIRFSWLAGPHRIWAGALHLVAARLWHRQRCWQVSADCTNVHTKALSTALSCPCLSTTQPHVQLPVRCSRVYLLDAGSGHKRTSTATACAASGAATSSLASSTPTRCAMLSTC